MKKHPNEFLRSNLNSGRFAGNGMSEGDYSEESFPDINPHARRTEIGRMSSRYIPKVGDPYGKEAVKDKNSEVRIIRPAKSKENEN